MSKSCAYITRNQNTVGPDAITWKKMGDSGNQRNPFPFCFFASLYCYLAFAFSVAAFFEERKASKGPYLILLVPLQGISLNISPHGLKNTQIGIKESALASSFLGI